MISRDFVDFTVKWIFVLLLSSVMKDVVCLKDVVMTIPEAVPSGESVVLQCHYDLEGDPLYAVKWYRGRIEFFRYLPKELPHTRTFAVAGVSVDERRSGPHQVVLMDLTPALSGRYRCEVSADAPSFDTAMVAGYLTIIDLPNGPPDIYVEKKRYSAGDTLKASCVSPPTLPATNLTWYINDNKINKIFYSNHPPESFNAIEEMDNQKKISMERIDELRNIGAEGLVEGYYMGQNGLRKIGFKRIPRDIQQGKIYGTPISATTSSPISSKSSPPERKRSKVYLEFPIGAKAFEDGKIKLRCTAELYQLYKANGEIILEEGPRLAPILATRDSGSGTIAHNGIIASTVVGVFIVLCILR